MTLKDFLQIFTKKKIIDFILNEVLGKFVGFLVGMWITKWFTYYAYEKKSMKNLFGLLPRKKVLVNTTPEWLQWLISAVVGFIVLELIYYFFHNKKYLVVWEYIKALSGKSPNVKNSDEVREQINKSYND